jgi:putative transposase
MKREKRTWTIEQKIAIIQEIEEKGLVETCRKHGIYPSLYYYWKEKYDSGGAEGLQPQYVKRNEKEMTNLQRENNRLKKILAEKELELQMKTELLKKKMQQWGKGKR